MWGLAVAYFFSEYFVRVSPSVMLPQLIEAFGTTAEGLGHLSAFFYYPYVLMQLPVGLLVDRYGVRKLLTGMAFLTALGCLLFAQAHTVGAAQLSRFVIGFSAAFAFVGSLRLAATWFPPRRLGLLAGLTQAVGMLGAAFGGAPVSFLVSYLGWRYAVLTMGAVFIVLALAIWCIVRDAPKTIEAVAALKKPKALGMWRGLYTVLVNPQTWWNGFYVGLLYAPTTALGELWGVAYLHIGRGFSPHIAAFANSLVFIGFGLAGPVAGWFSDRLGKRKPMLFISTFMNAILLLLLLYVPHLAVGYAYGLLFLLGVTNVGVSIGYAMAVEVNVREAIGASIAFSNMASVIIGALLQPIIGILLDTHSKFAAHGINLIAPSAFKSSMWMLPVCSILAFVCVFWMKETYCRPLHSLDARGD